MANVIIIHKCGCTVHHPDWSHIRPKLKKFIEDLTSEDNEDEENEDTKKDIGSGDFIPKMFDGL